MTNYRAAFQAALFLDDFGIMVKQDEPEYNQFQPGWEREVEMRKLFLGTLIFIVSMELIAAQKTGTSVFQDPGKVFSIKVPADWHMLYIPFSGERTFVFSVGKMTSEEMATGSNPKALVLVKMVRMSSADSKLALKDVAARYFKYLQEIYKQKNLPFTYKIGESVKIKGTVYVKTRIAAGNTAIRSFVTTHGGLFVELESQADKKTEKSFLPALQQALYSFQFQNIPVPGPERTILCAGNQLQLKVPSAWFVRRERSKDADQTFVSREKVEKPADIFHVGITINLFSDLRNFWKIDKQAKEASLLYNWYQAMNSSMKKRNGRIYAISSQNISGLKAVSWERSYQADDKSYIQEYHLIVPW